MGNCLFSRERNGSVPPAAGAAVATKRTGQTHQARSRTAPSTTPTAAGPNHTRESRLRVASWNVNGLHVGQEDKLTIICKIIWENKYNSYTWHNFYIIFYHAFYIVQTGFNCFSRASIHHREKECCSWIGKGNEALFTALCACMTNASNCMFSRYATCWTTLNVTKEPEYSGNMLVANVQEKLVLLRYYYHAPI